MTNRWLPWACAAIVCAACAPGTERPATSSTPTSNPTSASPTPVATEIERWKARAGDHFTTSGQALEKISKASAAGDEPGLWAACQQLHDANSIGLQDDLPTPDRMLTAELQKMIDDMNSATHACLRFVLGRKAVEADVYRDYLARAVEHLQSAKLILSALEQK